MFWLKCTGMLLVTLFLSLISLGCRTADVDTAPGVLAHQRPDDVVILVEFNSATQKFKFTPDTAIIEDDTQWVVWATPDGGIDAVTWVRKAGEPPVPGVTPKCDKKPTCDKLRIPAGNQGQHSYKVTLIDKGGVSHVSPDPTIIVER